MTSQITDQLAATNLSDASPTAEAHWKDGLTAPTKDARPQTEVCIPLLILG
jgi:ATP-dependent RNA helicase DDX6/DHH1